MERTHISHEHGPRVLERRACVLTKRQNLLARIHSTRLSSGTISSAAQVSHLKRSTVDDTEWQLILKGSTKSHVAPSDHPAPALRRPIEHGHITASSRCSGSSPKASFYCIRRDTNNPRASRASKWTQRGSKESTITQKMKQTRAHMPPHAMPASEKGNDGR